VTRTETKPACTCKSGGCRCNPCSCRNCGCWPGRAAPIRRGPICCRLAAVRPALDGRGRQKGLRCAVPTEIAAAARDDLGFLFHPIKITVRIGL